MTSESKQNEIQSLAVVNETSISASQQAFLDRIMSMDGVDADKLEKLMAMQIKWEERNAQKEFNEAFNRMKKELPVIKKDAQVRYRGRAGGLTSYNHVTLDNAAKAAKPVLQKHGFTVYWKSTPDKAMVITTCVLTHVSGHSIESSLMGPADASGGKNSSQAIGSSAAYFRRYTFCDVLGLVAEDDNDAQILKLVENKKILGEEWRAKRRAIKAPEKEDGPVLRFVIQQILAKPTIDFDKEYLIVYDAIFVQEMFSFMDGTDVKKESEQKQKTEKADEKGVKNAEVSTNKTA